MKMKCNRHARVGAMSCAATERGLLPSTQSERLINAFVSVAIGVHQYIYE
jgi:hypothetical protein